MEEDRQLDQWLLGRQQRMGELTGEIGKVREEEGMRSGLARTHTATVDFCGLRRIHATHFLRPLSCKTTSGPIAAVEANVVMIIGESREVVDRA